MIPLKQGFQNITPEKIEKEHDSVMRTHSKTQNSINLLLYTNRLERKMNIKGIQKDIERKKKLTNQSQAQKSLILFLIRIIINKLDCKRKSQ